MSRLCNYTLQTLSIPGPAEERPGRLLGWFCGVVTDTRARTVCRRLQSLTLLHGHGVSKYRMHVDTKQTWYWIA